MGNSHRDNGERMQPKTKSDYIGRVEIINIT